MAKENIKLQKYFVLMVTGLLLAASGFVLYNFSEFFSPKIILQKPVNILLIGMDGKGKEENRTDVIMLINIKPDLPRVSVISLPRDLRVYIPGHGQDKINAAYALGGQKLLKQTVSDFLGLPVTHYVRIDFIGLTNIVDRLGGVIIDVEKRMTYTDRSGNLDINLFPGLQRLTGQQAIGYVRFRHDSFGDLGRIQRQRKFIWALGEEISKVGNLTKIPELIEELGHNVESNISPIQMVYLALVAKKAYDEERVISTQLEGTPVMLNGVFFLEPDLPDVNKKITENVL